MTMSFASLQSTDWAKWAGQTSAVVSFELRKFRAGRKWVFPLLLAAAPVSLVTMLLLFDPRPPNNTDITEIFAVMFQTFMLRLMILFGCALVFANLYRGDMVTKTIHFYLLTPTRREVLVAGKYLAGLLITSILYGATVIITNILIHSANGQAVADAHFFGGPGMRQLFTYAGIAVLACVGYGSVFMVTGFLFKNPAIPAAFVLLWESFNVFLPSLLQKISVVHYLQSIVPVPIPFGPFAVITAPASVFASVSGLAVFTVAVLIVNSFLMRRAQVNYSAD
jgi:ABC-type transport system involved in multi-copper enzyme maturation permease subunit